MFIKIIAKIGYKNQGDYMSRKTHFSIAFVLIISAIFLLFVTSAKELPKKDAKDQVVNHTIDQATKDHLIANYQRFKNEGNLEELETGESFYSDQVDQACLIKGAVYCLIGKGAHDNGRECFIMTILDNNYHTLTILEKAIGCPPNCPGGISTNLGLLKKQ